MGNTQKYVALLRGINVGKHKVPMADLRNEMEGMGFDAVKTLLNSGNVVFETKKVPESELEEKISMQLEAFFGFPIPVMVRTRQAIRQIISDNPFEGIEVDKNTRLYVSFLKTAIKQAPFDIPKASSDSSFRIIACKPAEVVSVLDLSISNTPNAMDMLEKSFGKDITTRNWNTVLKIGRLME